jgi:hypothetical protein
VDEERVGDVRVSDEAGVADEAGDALGRAKEVEDLVNLRESARLVTRNRGHIGERRRKGDERRVEKRNGAEREEKRTKCEPRS